MLGVFTRTTALETELQGSLGEKLLEKTDSLKNEELFPLHSGFGII